MAASTYCHSSRVSYERACVYRKCCAEVRCQQQQKQTTKCRPECVENKAKFCWKIYLKKRYLDNFFISGTKTKLAGLAGHLPKIADFRDNPVSSGTLGSPETGARQRKIIKQGSLGHFEDRRPRTLFFFLSIETTGLVENDNKRQRQEVELNENVCFAVIG